MLGVNPDWCRIAFWPRRAALTKPVRAAEAVGEALTKYAGVTTIDAGPPASGAGLERLPSLVHADGVDIETGSRACGAAAELNLRGALRAGGLRFARRRVDRFPPTRASGFKPRPRRVTGTAKRSAAARICC